MKLTRIPSQDINHMDVAHLAMNITPGSEPNARAWLSIFGPVVTLELDLPITASSGSPVFWLPSGLLKGTAYFPPGYASDTGQIYRSSNYLLTGRTLTGSWVRRLWTWQRRLDLTFNPVDLLGSPPPLLLRAFSVVRRLAGWSK